MLTVLQRRWSGVHGRSAGMACCRVSPATLAEVMQPIRPLSCFRFRSWHRWATLASGPGRCRVPTSPLYGREFALPGWRLAFN
ncbi:hypothetical protein PXO_02427 [Xanthomonas oryzae pv. oryzae PXO99A]|uniref:Uncharacterized protein n=1 Tax=Xanthomonas oryzae pv. oryzae (strain PXO99A) TaxID=360094 RepID=A0A0K0GP88_XANOP|nr:hypothetical protein PXO_02427 [Xanthomonas oryzae pv. oryzae PXO99A]